MFSRSLSTVCACAAVLLGTAVPAGAATLPPGFSEQTMVSGLTRPMDVAWAPDGRMFVIQKDGLLLVVPPGSSRAVRVQDFSTIVNGQNDRGLLGLAVDADFAANRYVYLLFTYDIGATPETDGPMVSQLLRLEVSTANQVTDQTAILGTDVGGVCDEPANGNDCLPSEGSTHTIGTVRADPDGSLWVSNGDGFGANQFPPPVRTYDEESLSGKILHIDRDGNGLEEHPFCPGQDNLDSVCTKVHSMGFRNPFRFTLRPGGGLVVGDVGWTRREEIDLIGASGGGNYGWPCFEGSIPTPGYLGEMACDGVAPGALPAYDYEHFGSNSVVGGPTYTGAGYPAAYRNSIFFGDFTGGFVRRLVPNGAGGFSVQPFATGWGGVALETAPNGDLVSVNPVNFGVNGAGTVTRITYAPPGPAPPASPPPPAPAPPADTRGPRLRLGSIRPRRGLVSGTARDQSGVRRVEVAVRRRLRGRGCSWWLRSQGTDGPQAAPLRPATLDEGQAEAGGERRALERAPSRTAAGGHLPRARQGDRPAGQRGPAAA